MPVTRKSKESHRKLNFEHPNDDDDDDDVVVIEQQTHQHAAADSRKRAVPPPSSSPAIKRQKGIDSYLSPKKKGKSAAVVVTPAENSARKATAPKKASTVADYVPTYVHKCVEYLREGQATNLSPLKSKVFQLIKVHYEIPKDFEQNRTYGPLSGSSYEDRVIAAYRLGKLDAVVNNNANDVDTVICTACAEMGHAREQCPILL